jgi:hypothetical protein
VKAIISTIAKNAAFPSENHDTGAIPTSPSPRPRVQQQRQPGRDREPQRHRDRHEQRRAPQDAGKDVVVERQLLEVRQPDEARRRE